MNGTPSYYEQYFEMDEQTGLVRQVKRADRSVVKSFLLHIRAEQTDNPERYAIAKLVIQVLAVDRSPPIIKATANTGYIPENSPLGSFVSVFSDRKTPLRLTVTDPDLVSTNCWI